MLRKQEQIMEKDPGEENLNKAQREKSTSQVEQTVPQKSNRKMRERIQEPERKAVRVRNREYDGLLGER